MSTTVNKEAVQLYQELTANYSGVRMSSYEQMIDREFDKYSKREHCDISIAPGWWPLTTKCLDDITTYLKDAAPEYEFFVIQIKEKFGGLRIYGHLAPKNADPEVDWVDAPAHVIRKVSDFRSIAEKRAAKTCEVCGEDGEVRATTWIRTLCDKHHNEWEAR